ncbi:VWA domain-containing protein [uncultured Roseovarius sp.]|uniref:vWA domain-containing protein n=1 Tax=uncultured Roseovarius sp. TaxID=293344 RepID=UPI002627C67B|nr:vWA domain-containing protein [uncultured Roseovarius sp.]
MSRLNSVYVALIAMGIGLISACSHDAPSEAEPRDSAADYSASPSPASPAIIDAAPGRIAASEKSSRIAKAPSQRQPRTGVVTAGDIDDTLNVAAFQTYLKRKKRTVGTPTANFSRPFMAQLVGPNGQPAAGVYFTLRKPGAPEPFYSGHSGVDGNITVFPATLGAGQFRQVEFRAITDGQTGTTIKVLKTGLNRHKIALADKTRWTPAFLDLAFVVDTTGSMGDELDWLTREMRSIVDVARKAAPGVDIRFSLVVYRDHGDAYIVRNMGFSNSAATMQRWLKRQNASGGGDYPEAAAAALKSAVNLNWRRGKGERILFHIADAPPHARDARTYLAAARTAAKRNIQIFGLGASGVADEAELLMRQAAAMTSGRYLFLTDDSGVGLSHAEPDIACYRVTKLKDLLIRVLKSELSGTRIEAAKSSIIREVGAYRRGICLN